MGTNTFCCGTADVRFLDKMSQVQKSGLIWLLPPSCEENRKNSLISTLTAFAQTDVSTLNQVDQQFQCVSNSQTGSDGRSISPGVLTIEISDVFRLHQACGLFEL